MTILFLESGTDATQGLEFFTTVTGTVASSSAQSHIGPRSVLCSGSSSDFVTSGNLTGLGAWATSGRVSAWFRFTGNGAAQPNSGKAIGSNFSGTSFGISRNASNFIDVIDGVTVRASGSVAVGNNEWIRISIAFTRTSSSVNRFKVFINGTLEHDLTNITWTSPPDRAMFGNSTNSFGTYVDDMYADDDSSLTDPGDIRITAKLPASDNTVNFDTTVGTGAVNERPLSVTNGQQHAAATDVQENYTLEGAGAGDANCSDNRILGYTGWVYGKRSADYSGGYTQTIGTVNNKTGNHTTTVIPTTNDSTGSGYAIIVAFACDDDTGDTTATCADSQGNSYAAGQSVQIATTGNQAGTRAAVFIALNATALTGSDVITITHASIDASAAIAIEVEGIVTSDALDTSATTTFASSTTFDTGATGETSQPGTYKIGILGLEGDTGDWGTFSFLATTEQALSEGTTGGGRESNVAIRLATGLPLGITSSGFSGSALTSGSEGSALTAYYKFQAGYGTYGDPKIMLDGTETSITLTESNALYTKIVDGPYYPDDAAGIGMRSAGASVTTDTFMYECGVLIAFTPTPLSVLRKRRPYTIRN